MPAPLSPAPRPRVAALHAGLGRGEITPPPSAGLFGYGPEGKAPEGFGRRLYARALVLEDAGGERVALVVADLGAISLLLHREVADRLLPAFDIGADRLFLAATHTHSGPGNFFGLAYDEFGTGDDASGFDPDLLQFLAEGIARAVADAVRDLRPAAIAWGSAPFWGYTRNRALEAFRLNQPAWRAAAGPPPGLGEAERAVNPRWTLLRVDQRGDDGVFRPAGAFSVFAIHGTALPSANRLYDADVHAVLAERLERHIDTRYHGRPLAPRPTAVHLVANGIAGDVSPNVSLATRCPAPRLKARILEPLAFSPGAPIWREPAAGVIQACLDSAQRERTRVGRALGDSAIRLFDSLRPMSDVRIARAFRTYLLYGTEGELAGLCPQPLTGVATPSGVADGKTRYDGLLGIYEGHRELRTTECQRPKIPFLGPAQADIAAARGLPWRAQFGAIRIGGMLLVTVPGEITTAAGGRIEEALAGVARAQGFRGEDAALVSLTNGYMNYTTTPEEYMRQGYEGSSTLYGPNQAEAFRRALLDLAGTLRYGESSPAALVRADSGRVLFDAKVRIPPADQGPATVSRIAEGSCDARGLHVRWSDLHPGRMLRDRTPWFTITDSGGAMVAWDDHDEVEVRALGAGATGYRWQLDWRGARPGARYEVTFRPTGESTEVEVACPSTFQ